MDIMTVCLPEDFRGGTAFDRFAAKVVRTAPVQITT
jgi:hypothetical protein